MDVSVLTERLLLRRWRPTDVEPYAALCADPEVMRYLGGPMSRADVERQVARFTAHWERHGFGLWAAELRADGAFLGYVGLARPDFLPEVLPAVEVGFRLARPYWGRGLATEGAAASLRRAFTDLGLDRVISVRHVDNDASGRVVDKLGLRLDRRTVHPVSGVPLLVTAITRDEWAQRRRPPEGPSP